MSQTQDTGESRRNNDPLLSSIARVERECRNGNPRKYFENIYLLSNKM